MYIGMLNSWERLIIRVLATLEALLPFALKLIYRMCEILTPKNNKALNNNVCLPCRSTRPRLR